jgi:electron transport complex protein RnfD
MNTPAPTVSTVMTQVLWALVPAVIAHWWFFGPGILIQITLAVVIGGVLEAAMLRLRGRPVWRFLNDRSMVLAAVLLALCLPPLAPWWVVATGMVFAMVIAKHLYGGIGQNLFNPAMVGFAVVIISFPIELTQWLLPRPLNPQLPTLMQSLQAILSGQLPPTLSWDVISQATPLDQARTGRVEGLRLSEVQRHPVFGAFGGVAWAPIALAYAIGGTWLLARGIIHWRIPATILLVTVAISLLPWLADSDRFMSPLHHLTSGALVMAAFFIATDPVSGCSTPRGQVAFCVGVVLITLAIRQWGAFPDGVAFGILMMNMVAPLLDRMLRPSVYGERRRPTPKVRP